MLNYLSAEWYKLRHTKGIFIAFGILLALIASVFLPAFWYLEPTFEVYAVAYLAFLPLGFFLAPIFAVKAFDDQYGRGTLKNEIVFGIPRSRCYLGKLAMGGLAGTAAALIVLGFYLLMSFLSGGLGEEGTLYLRMCIRGTFLTLPLWLASLSLCFCLQAVVKSSSGAVALDYILLFFGLPMSLIAPDAPTGSLVWKFFRYCFFVAPYRGIYNTTVEQQRLGASAMGYAWLVGLGWIAATTLVGIAFFNKKEIK